MKKTVYTNYDELPVMLSVPDVAQIMGIGLRTGVGAGKVLWHHRKTIIPPREPNEAQEKKGEANHGKQSSVE